MEKHKRNCHIPGFDKVVPDVSLPEKVKFRVTDSAPMTPFNRDGQYKH
jgi:hypothetical protein